MHHLRTLFFSSLAALYSLPINAAELVMVEQPGCVYCLAWDHQLGPIYPKTSEGQFAPLRKIQISDTTDSEINFDRRISFTPTFVLVENNTELARIEGYTGDDFFWAILSMMLEAETEYTGAGS